MLPEGGGIFRAGVGSLGEPAATAIDPGRLPAATLPLVLVLVSSCSETLRRLLAELNPISLSVPCEAVSKFCSFIGP